MRLIATVLLLVGGIAAQAVAYYRGPSKLQLLGFLLLMAAVLLSAGCGCTFQVQGICIIDETDSVDTVDVRAAVEAVEQECSLTLREPLTVSLLQDAPDTSKSGTPIPGLYQPSQQEAKIWMGYERPFDTLRHELIHAGMDLAGRESDAAHEDPLMWCFDGCEVRILESCYSAL